LRNCRRSSECVIVISLCGPEGTYTVHDSGRSPVIPGVAGFFRIYAKYCAAGIAPGIKRRVSRYQRNEAGERI
jgi:hypothetical protein